MKDENNGEPISEFVGLRSKMYSFTCNGRNEKRAKGIAKVTVKKELKHDSYKDVLFNETSSVSSMCSLRRSQHELFGETIQKIGLSSFDDKRCLIDAVKSHAYGHYKIAGDTNNVGGNVVENSDEMTIAVVPVRDVLTGHQHKTLDEQVFTLGDFKITPCINI